MGGKFQLGHVFSDMDCVSLSLLIEKREVAFQLGHVFSDMDCEGPI